MLQEEISKLAIKLGFEQVGIAPVIALNKQLTFLEKWIENGYNAKMDYFLKNNDSRYNPAILLDNAKSIIVLTQPYPANVKYKNHIKIAKYALIDDYHKTIYNKLKLLANELSNEYNTNCRCFVDSGKLLEKQLAVLAGIGWQGKSSLIVNERWGTAFFIGIIITDLEIPPSPPIESQCGECHKCIDACPTAAIIESKVIDSNKCLAYHSIENRGKLPIEIANAIENTGYIFGCDICQDVCPYNKKIQNAPPEHIFNINDIIDLNKIDKFSEEDFNTIFYKSSVKRAKYAHFINCLRIALKGQGE